MEKTFLLYLSVHWGDLIEQTKKKSVIYTLRSNTLMMYHDKTLTRFSKESLNVMNFPLQFSVDD